jgi:hypothetical protein
LNIDASDYSTGTCDRKRQVRDEKTLVREFMEDENFTQDRKF